MLDSKPVEMALEQIMNLTNRGKIKLYSYLQDFDTLWGFAELIKSLKAKEDIVVIWDEIPNSSTGSVNTALYLTPIDWAVAFSLAVCKEETNKPNFRITIIDLNSDSFASAPAVRFVNNFPKRDIMSMPWVRLVRPIYCATDKNGYETNERDIKDVIIEFITGPVDVSNFKTILQTYLLDSSHDIDVVRSVWRANIVKTSNPDDNHAIANLVGPMLLCPTSVNPSPSICALQKLLGVLGLYPADFTGILPNEVKIEWRNLSERLKTSKAKILLVDDQWQDGWGRALCDLLYCNYEVKNELETSSHFSRISATSDELVVKACESPEWLFDFLKNKLNDHRYKLYLDSDDMGCDTHNHYPMEILFLDLRLFSGKKIDCEANYIRNLAVIAEEQNKLGIAKWKKIDDLVSIKTWADDVLNGKLHHDQARKHHDYNKALSLLPRIIANIDPSYPVIIFSSTGRREIVKCFTGFDNILSVFEKPRLAEQFGSELIIESGEKLRSMINNALNILEVRKLLNDIKSIEIQNNCKTYTGEHAHVELYIDEHHPDKTTADEDKKRNNIWIGGCFAVFNGSNKTEAINKANAFDDALISNGYNYYSRGEYLPAITVEIKDKNDPATVELRSAFGGTAVPAIIEPIRLKHAANIKEDDDGIGDYAYRTSIKLLLEYFIFEMLPQIQIKMKFDSISFSVFAGTRVASHADEFRARLLAYRNGLFVIPQDKQPGKFLLESLSSSTIFTITDDLLKYRTSIYDLERAIGTTMIYDKDHGKTKHKPKGSLYCRDCPASFEDNNLKDKKLAGGGNELAQVKSISIDQDGNKHAEIFTLDQELMKDHWKIVRNNSANIKLNTAQIGIFDIKPFNYLSVKLHRNINTGYEVLDVISVIDKKDLPEASIIWSEFKACPICGKQNTIRPDYRGGLYIADHLVDEYDYSTGKYKDVIKIDKLGFDEEVDENIFNIVHSGYLVDNSNFVKGIIKAAEVMNSRPDYNKSAIISTVLTRIAPKLETMSPNSFHEIVKAITKEVTTVEPLGRQQITIISKISSNVDCKDSNGNDVFVSFAAYSETKPAVREKMKPQSTLWATLYQVGDVIKAKQISLHEKYDDIVIEQSENSIGTPKVSLQEMFSKVAQKNIE